MKAPLATLLASMVLIVVIAYAASRHYGGRELRGYEPPARYRVWEDSPDPFATPQDYIREVRFRKLHLHRPDLIPYPLDVRYYC